MQSGGYGGVSEIQQFMVDNCGVSLFPISSAHPSSAGAAHPLKYHALPLPHQHPQQLLPPQQGLPPPHLAHFHSIPIMQQLFHQTAAAAATAAAHPFQLFHVPQQQYLPEPRRLVPPDQLALDQESAPENSASPTRIVRRGGGGGGQSFLAAAMRFNLGAKESSEGGSRKVIHDEDGILQGDDGSESGLHHWQREDESAINELPWRPLDIDYINRNSKRCNKDMEPETSNPKYPKRSKEIAEVDLVEVAGGSSSNYKIFSELEAIYKPGAGPPNNQTTGSGSALTGDEIPLLHTRAANVAAPGLPFARSEMSAEDNERTAANKSSSMGGGRRRRKKRHQQLAAMAAFFEGLVKQLMDHQEGLHQRLLDVMEFREQERAGLEDAWRKQEAARSGREAAARAHDRALACSREGAIVAFIEKITGEALTLPLNPHLPSADVDGYEQDTTSNLQIEPYDPDNGNSKKAAVFNNSCRWPKAEVQALIQVRSGLEWRFQESGLKGPLWEEVSAAMAAIGCQRNAKRCKEKWENINKYFRKAKEKGKNRPQQSKTCPYFQQLDQLYSKSLSKNPNADATGDGQRMKANSELLDAIVVPAGQPNFMFVIKEGDKEDAEQKEEGEELECEGENHGHQNDVLHDPSLFFEHHQS